MSAFARLFLRERLEVSPFRKGIVDLEIDDCRRRFALLTLVKPIFKRLRTAKLTFPVFFGRPRARAIDAERGA